MGWGRYPYEWLADEELSQAVVPESARSTRWLEPPWKIVLGNKAILPMLWEMYIA